MRSELVHRAAKNIVNRFELCQLLSKGTRRLHKPQTRCEETINWMLNEVHEGRDGCIVPPEIAPVV